MAKWFSAILILLLLAAVGIGFAAQWQLLGLLEVGDRLWPGAAGTRVGEGIAYGDDPIQQVDVYVPPGLRAGERRPVVVWLHGGGWAHGSRPLYGWAGRAYSSEGFVTVVAGYRLGAAGHWPRFMEDGAAAVHWARANAARFGGDPDNIIIAGHSAGAHIATLLALDPRWLGDMVRPGGAVKGAIGLSGPYDFLPMEPGGRGDVAMGDARPLSQTQPINYVRADAPALFLGTGDADTTVRPRNTRALSAAQANMLGIVDAKVTTSRRPSDVITGHLALSEVTWRRLGHEDVVMALSLPFRGKAPVLRQSAEFVRRVTARTP